MYEEHQGRFRRRNRCSSISGEAKMQMNMTKDDRKMLGTAERKTMAKTGKSGEENLI